MILFRRVPEPAFWAQYEARWLANPRRTVAPLGWRHEGETLRSHFHRIVRDGGPRNCAYCDGSLGETSRHIIDHFYPHAEIGPCTRLAWENLYPSCDHCNETFKGTQWSCNLVRPDIEPFWQWIDFQTTGALRPRLNLDRRTKGRVILNLRVFGLNAKDRCEARRKRFEEYLELAHRRPERLAAYRSGGVYRFILPRVEMAIATLT